MAGYLPPEIFSQKTELTSSVRKLEYRADIIIFDETFYRQASEVLTSELLSSSLPAFLIIKIE